MKINVSVTLDINADAWASEFGVDKKDVRQDMRTYVQSVVDGQIASIGLHSSEHANREWH